MKLSFILPAYKRRYLAEAIDSILRQTFADFELIVVDDCSPENLREVVAGFSDARLRSVRNEQNLGGTSLIAAWNKAVSLAKGEWCVLASDDDVYAPTYAEKMLALAAKHSECEVLHCRTGIIDGNGVLTKIAEKRPEFESCADLLYARGVKRCLQTAPEFMFKRAALERIGGFVDFPLAWYSDDATWLLLAREHGVACSSEVLFHWRYSGENISSRFDITAKKVAAGERYKKWFTQFLSDFKPLSEEEQVIIRHAADLSMGVVNRQTRYDLDDTALMPWLKIVMGGAMPAGLKLLTLLDRARKMLGF